MTPKQRNYNGYSLVHPHTTWDRPHKLLPYRHPAIIDTAHLLCNNLIQFYIIF